MIKATEQPHNAHKMFRVALRSHGEFGERRDVLGGDLAVSDRCFFPRNLLRGVDLLEGWCLDFAWQFLD